MRFGFAMLPCVMLLCCSCAARGDVPKKAELFDPARHLRVDEVKPGMTGYGVSVFSGTKLERFDVEVISVMKNMMGPRQDVVLIRCRGQGLEHSGAIAGMSGSPIYLKDDQGRERMIGAFALGWEFSKDPIAGVRPIEEMLRVPAEAREPVVVKAQASTWDARPLVRQMYVDRADPATAARPLIAEAAPANAIRPLALPLSVSGVSPSFVQRIQPLLTNARLKLLQSGGAGTAPAEAKDARLVPGAAIGVPIVTGDLELSAIGTVTEVLGDRVFAFGHEFNAEGAVDLPMGVGYIHSVIPNQSISFKLGSLIRTDGAIHSDESVAIAGMIGKTPEMIPVSITVLTPQREQAQTYHYQVARHPRFTPMGTSISILSAMMGHSRLPEEFTARYDLKMEFEDGHVVQVSNQTTSLMQAAELFRDLQTPLQLGIDNPFKKVYPARVTGKVEIAPAIHAATLRTAVTDKSIYKPGETVKIFVITRLWRGSDETTGYDLKLPDDLPDGPLTITAGDSQRFGMDEIRFAPFKFQADNIDDVFSLLQTLTGDRSDRLYLRLTQPSENVSVGRQDLGRLPGGKKALLTRTPAPDVTAYPPSIVHKHDLQTPVIGSADVQIIVAKHPERAPQLPPPVVSAPPPGAPTPPQR